MKEMLCWWKMPESKEYSWGDDKCPYCNSTDLDYDLIETDDGVHHDIVTCNSCKKELIYEE